MTRYRLDPSTRRIASSDIVLGGSPLRLFRLTSAGVSRFDQLSSGTDVDESGRLLERLVDAGAVHPVARHAAERLADTTVVIPSHAPDVARLSALVDGCHRDVAGVVVVDDASPVPIGEVVGATVMRHTTRAGPAAARNTGAGQVVTRFVAFVDDDVSFTDGDWLPLLLGHFDDDAVAAVAPRVRSRGGVSPIARYEREHSPLDLGPLPGVVGPGRRISYVPAAALVIRRDVLAAAGGFDTTLRFGEDVDLVWRLTAAGHRCRYEPEGTVEHEARHDWPAWVRQRVGYGSSAAPLAARHRGALAPVRTTWWSAGIWALVSARRPLLAAGIAAFTAGALVRKVVGLGGRESVRLTALGHLYAGRSLAAAVRRAWWPLVIVGALRSRWCRRLLIMSIAASVAEERGRPRDLIAGLADDVCYGTGVWRGVLANRELGPLIPQFISWPGSASDR